jgi:putative transcriptional regulator
LRLWLKNYRVNLDLTQEEVAEQSGIARSTYGAIETGERNATVQNAKSIAKVLGFNWTLFFEDEYHNSKNKSTA